MTLHQKLDKITFPIRINGYYTFRDTSEALSILTKRHGYLNERGRFKSLYPNDDPNQQELGAAINYYLFDISNKDSKSLNEMKKKYFSMQNIMFVHISYKKTAEETIICPSLKEICKFSIRKNAAAQLNFIRKNKGYKPTFKPLFVFGEKYRLDSYITYSSIRKDKYNKKNEYDRYRYDRHQYDRHLDNGHHCIEWNPKLVEFLKCITKDIPTTLQDYVNLKNPEYFQDYVNSNRLEIF